MKKKKIKQGVSQEVKMNEMQKNYHNARMKLNRASVEADKSFNAKIKELNLDFDCPESDTKSIDMLVDIEMESRKLFNIPELENQEAEAFNKLCNWGIGKLKKENGYDEVKVILEDKKMIVLHHTKIANLFLRLK